MLLPFFLNDFIYVQDSVDVTGVRITMRVGTPLVWGQPVDTGTPSWTSGTTAQTPGWVVETSSQNPNWSPIISA